MSPSRGPLARSAQGLARLGFLVSTLAVAAIVVLLVFSSVQRYLLAQPLALVDELASLLFVTFAFLPLAWTLLQERHIRLTVLTRRLPARWQPWLAVVGDLASLAICLILAAELLEFALVSRAYDSRSMNSDLLLWPWMALPAVGLALLAFGLLARVAGDVALLRRGERPQHGDHTQPSDH